MSSSSILRGQSAHIYFLVFDEKKSLWLKQLSYVLRLKTFDQLILAWDMVTNLLFLFFSHFYFCFFFLEWQHINTIKCRWVRNQLTFLFLQQRFVCQLCLMRSCHWLILFFTILNNNTQFSGVRRSPVWPSSWPRSRRASTGSSARTAPTVSVRANGLKDCPHILGKDNCIELSIVGKF